VTWQEFRPIFAYLQNGCGMREPPTKEQAAVYFDLLQDLPAETVEAAAKTVLIDHIYPNLPPAGAIRKAALSLGNNRTDPAEAWSLFLTAVRRFGTGTRRVFAQGMPPQVIDCEARGLESLPPDIRRAARACWAALAETSPEYLGAVQKRFTEMLKQTSDDAERQRVLPPSVRQTIAAIASGVGRGVAAIEGK
jgi:hypothetical protein